MLQLFDPFWRQTPHHNDHNNNNDDDDDDDGNGNNINNAFIPQQRADTAPAV